MEESRMLINRYIIDRRENVWTIKLNDEGYGPYRSQAEAVLFAIDAAEQLNEYGENALIVLPSDNGSLPTCMDLQAGHRPRVLVSLAA
jgi:hypothetical protein